MRPVKIRQKMIEFPIIQGGMGVGISLSSLASAAINEGCMGVISAAQPGYREPDFYDNTFEANLRALKSEINQTRKQTQHKGILAINMMVAAKRYKEYIREITKMDIDAIISGAGLPLDLPELVDNKDILLAPMVSSAQAASLICRVWQKRYERLPDFLIVEGPKAGGHLGFKPEDLINHTTQTLEEILSEVLDVLKGVGPIPVFVAGGILTGSDIFSFLKQGATGVQMGTAFIATKECDASIEFKQSVIKSTKATIAFTKSPSKLYGRAVKTDFMKEVNQRTHNIRVKGCVACLSTCNPTDTPYCITQALIDSANGKVDEGIVFVGERASEIHEITSVKELIQKLKSEVRDCYE